MRAGAITSLITLGVVGFLSAFFASLGAEGNLPRTGVRALAQSAPLSFQDCAECPTMIAVPAGTFLMGAERWPADPSLIRDAGPVRRITIRQPFAAGRFEVTFDQWDACVRAGGCNGYSPPDEGFGRGNRPVLYVSWLDARQYVTWLSEHTGQHYRLLTEAEWEYAARAGMQTPYPWGRYASHIFANYGRARCCEGRVLQADRWYGTSPAGSFPANAFGLHDTQGNAYEWVADCYAPRYDESIRDERAMLTEPCDRHVIRGGAWYSDPGRIRSSYRGWQTPDKRDRVIGFRIARTLYGP